jgi:hypothetical protein
LSGSNRNISDFSCSGHGETVVSMPVGDSSIIADFLRYHVLIRVFNGNPDAWLESLRTRPDDACVRGDIRFARWIRARSRRDPAFLETVGRMVEQTELWT